MRVAVGSLTHEADRFFQKQRVDYILFMRVRPTRVHFQSLTFLSLFKSEQGMFEKKKIQKKI